MFNIVDKDGDNRISFQEFLDTIVLFSKGRTDDKLRIIFDMCDNDKNGSIDKKELSELIANMFHVISLISGISDKIGRRNVFHMFTIGSVPLFASLPYCINQVVMDPTSAMAPVYLGIFCASTVASISVFKAVLLEI